MSRRLVNFHIADDGQNNFDLRIDEILEWYSSHREHTLTVNFWIEKDVQAHLEQVLWIIMQLRMRKRDNQGDPKFNLLVSQPLMSVSMDLLSGLDTRLPKLLFSPRADQKNHFEDLEAFFHTFAPSLEHRLIDVRPLIWVSNVEDCFDLLIGSLKNFLDADLPYPSSPPAIEVPYDSAIPDPEKLCHSLAQLWSTYPGLTDTLGWFGDGYIKRFYQLKEIWHLAQLLGREPSSGELDSITLNAVENGANSSDIKAFDATFLSQYGNNANYVKWRPNGNNVVLEFDLDSIADTHECQSPVFLNGKWILDRDNITASVLGAPEEISQQNESRRSIA